MGEEPERLKKLLARIYDRKPSPPESAPENLSVPSRARSNAAPPQKTTLPPISHAPNRPLPPGEQSDPLYWFPHARLRPPQRAFFMKAKQAYAQRKHVAAHLPTGVGKTAIALAAALATSAPYVLYLTNRQTQHEIVTRELANLSRTKGVDVGFVDLISKYNMCINPDAKWDRSSGKRRERHYNEFLDACRDLVKHRACEQRRRVEEAPMPPPLPALQMVSLGQQHDTCPYYLALSRTPESRVLIGDYNLAITGQLDVVLERIQVRLEDCVVVFDEAHNVPTRVCGHHTRKIRLGLFDLAIQDLQQHGGPEGRGLDTHVETMRRRFQQLWTKPMESPRQGRVAEANEVDTAPATGSDPDSLTRLVTLGESIYAKVRRMAVQRVARFIKQWNQDWPQLRIVRPAGYGIDEDSGVKADPKDARNLGLELRVIDPKPFLKDLLDKCHWSLWISGTLHPVDVFAQLVGLDATNAVTLTQPSPFPPENRIVHHEHILSTRQAGRNEDLWAAYGRRITSQILPTGNVVIFAPSADIVQQLLPHLPKDDRPLRVETPQWNQEDRLAVCDELRKRKDTGCILVAYFRGGFSEGIDLPGGVIPQIFLIGLPIGDVELGSQGDGRVLSTSVRRPAWQGHGLQCSRHHPSRPSSGTRNPKRVRRVQHPLPRPTLHVQRVRPTAAWRVSCQAHQREMRSRIEPRTTQGPQ